MTEHNMSSNIIPTSLRTKFPLHHYFAYWWPVHTILPVPKMRVAVLGFFNLKTRPGKTLGLYSVWGNFSTIFCKSIFWLRETEATMFWMLMIGFLLLMSTHALEYLSRIGVYKAFIYKRVSSSDLTVLLPPKPLEVSLSDLLWKCALGAFS